MALAPAAASRSIRRAWTSFDHGPSPKAARLASSMPTMAISVRGAGLETLFAASYSAYSSRWETPVAAHTTAATTAINALKKPSVRHTSSRRAEVLLPTCCCSTSY
ncbi:hypothetical protein D3C71_1484370 [compost metagenome]